MKSGLETVSSQKREYFDFWVHFIRIDKVHLALLKILWAYFKGGIIFPLVDIDDLTSTAISAVLFIKRTSMQSSDGRLYSVCPVGYLIQEEMDFERQLA